MVRFAKPRARPLHTVCDCNYIRRRLCGTRKQNVFANRPLSYIYFYLCKKLFEQFPKLRQVLKKAHLLMYYFKHGSKNNYEAWGNSQQSFKRTSPCKGIKLFFNKGGKVFKFGGSGVRYGGKKACVAESGNSF